MRGVGAGAGDDDFSEMSESGVLRLLSLEKRRLSLSTSILDH
jgi:hypothetical protein